MFFKSAIIIILLCIISTYFTPSFLIPGIISVLILLVLATRGAWLKEKTTLNRMSHDAKEKGFLFYPAYRRNFVANIGEKMGMPLPDKKLLLILNQIAQLDFYWPNNSDFKYIWYRDHGDTEEIICTHVKSLNSGGKYAGTHWVNDMLLVISNPKHKLPEGKYSIDGQENLQVLPSSITIFFKDATLYVIGNALILCFLDKTLSTNDALEYLRKLNEISAIEI